MFQIVSTISNMHYLSNIQPELSQNDMFQQNLHVIWHSNTYGLNIQIVYNSKEEFLKHKINK